VPKSWGRGGGNPIKTWGGKRGIKPQNGERGSIKKGPQIIVSKTKKKRERVRKREGIFATKQSFDNTWKGPVKTTPEKWVD